LAAPFSTLVEFLLRELKLARGQLARGQLARGQLARGQLARGQLVRGQLTRGQLAACWRYFNSALGSIGLLGGLESADQRLFLDRHDLSPRLLNLFSRFPSDAPL